MFATNDHGISIFGNQNAPLFASEPFAQPRGAAELSGFFARTTQPTIPSRASGLFGFGAAPRPISPGPTPAPAQGPVGVTSEAPATGFGSPPAGSQQSAGVNGLFGRPAVAFRSSQPASGGFTFGSPQGGFQQEATTFGGFQFGAQNARQNAAPPQPMIEQAVCEVEGGGGGIGVVSFTVGQRANVK